MTTDHFIRTVCGGLGMKMTHFQQKKMIFVINMHTAFIIVGRA